MLHVLFPTPVVAVVVDDVCSFWVAVAVPGSVVAVDWVVVDISTRLGGDWLDICGMDSLPGNLCLIVQVLNCVASVQSGTAQRQV